MTKAVAKDMLYSAASKRGSSALPRNETPSKRSRTLCGYMFLGHTNSVLHHPMGLPLTRSFMEMTAPAADGDQACLANDLFIEFSDENLANMTGSFIRPSLTSFDDVFQTSYDAWLQLAPNRRQEPQLTSRLARSMATQLKRYNLHVHGQEVVPDEVTGGTGNLDISVHADGRSDEKGNSTPLLIVEFGFDVELWWEKFDRGVCYVTNHPRFQEAGAVLLAVVTTEKATLTCTTGTSRFGVFLITPKHRSTKRNDYRISLLWHKEVNGLTSLSKCFGKLLRATCRLPAMKDVAKSMIANETYRCLGPNCCMIKVNEEKLVLRAYDNRAYPTDRRPDVYLHANETGKTGVVCDFVEGRERGDDDFGCTQEGDDSCSWLWKGERRISSRLLVIFTTFWEGRHYAKSILEFVPLIEHMQRLHKKDFVHGDVRCFNIIFNPERSCLIDFDIGGKINAADFPANNARIEGAELQSDIGKGTGDDGKERKAAVLKYPRGYNKDLPDGKRLGQEGKKISKFNDAVDLTYVIFGLHNVLPPAMDEPASASEESVASAPDPDDQSIEEATMEQQIKKLQEERRLLKERDKMLQEDRTLMKERDKMLQEERRLLKERDSLASIPSIHFAPNQMEDYAAQHLEKVKTFLQKVAATNWTVSPESRYMLVLQSHGLHITSGPETKIAGGNDTATGSPPKNDPP